MDRTERQRRLAFYILMFLIVAAFVVGEVVYPSERTEMSLEANIRYPGTFTWEKTDGSSEIIQVPGKYDVSVGETMVLTTVLPTDYTANAIGLRSSLQDIKYYIDGELRGSYDTKDTRPFGKNSASRYVFCETSEKDAGKELKIELTTYTSNYSGVVNEVYYGDKGDIWTHIFNEHGTQTLIAFFILFTGVVTILFSIALGMVYQTKFDMEYLGWCMLMGSVWMLGESKMRQLWIPNASIMASMCFVVIILCPIPLLFYIDSVQKHRYTGIYRVIEGVALLNFVVETALQLAGIVDYIETMPVDHVILILTFAAITVTFIMDIRHGESREYHLVLSGCVVAMTAILIEVVSSYFVVSLSGVFVGTGLLILLFVNIICTLKRVHYMEIQRQQEELEKRRRQMEKMSLRMIRTLSTTMEAKNEYSKGHSYRVAQYAGMIAREMGWSSSEIRHLKNAAYVHDVGRIGIPDSILNKPSKLTEEEYAMIKAHTVIGADVLKDITVIEHAAEVARSHHERYDGKGYPDGLKGEEILIQARIVAVADRYDAMSTRRIYRKALSQEQILEKLKDNRGTQFDPVIVDVFVHLMETGKAKIEEEEAEEREDDITELERGTEKFISEVMATMKSQGDEENYDYLTGLPIRSRGETLIAQIMQEKSGCLAFVDMDNLKRINDIYGHKAGDRALKLLGKLLSAVDKDAVACRFGGDEFILFLPDMEKDQVTQKMEKLFETFRNSKEEDVEIRCASLSAGLCMTEPGDSFENSYMNADKTLYYVKQNGKDRFFFYRQMSEERRKESTTGRDLQKVAAALQESGSYSGALEIDFRGFARLYEYMNSLSDRYKHSCYLVMVTMDTVWNQTLYMEQIEEALDCMEQAIRYAIRKVDICTRYSAMQYLIILFEPQESQISKVMERIFWQYYQLYEKGDFKPDYEYILISEKNR